jgi:hypothetical protein
MPSVIDEYEGQGGEYLLNPKTGKRTLISRTEPAESPAHDEALTDAIAFEETPDLGEEGDAVRPEREPSGD